MTIEHICIALLGLLLVIEKAAFFYASRGWTREREQLYNRIQAGTLGEYAAYKPALETAETPKKVNSGGDNDFTPEITELPEDALVQVQTDFNALMG